MMWVIRLCLYINQFAFYIIKRFSRVRSNLAYRQLFSLFVLWWFLKIFITLLNWWCSLLHSQSSVELFEELATSPKLKCFCLFLVLIDSIDQTFILYLVSVVWWISSTVLDHESVVILRIFNHSTMGEFVLIYKLLNLSHTDQFVGYSFNGDHVVILMYAMLLWCGLTVHSECWLQLYGNWSCFIFR